MTRPGGGLRYQEILVVNAGSDVGELDKPEDEIISVRAADGSRVLRGQDWETWWYRRPQNARPEAPRQGGQPSPRRMAAWEATSANDHPEPVLAESGTEFPNRFRRLKRIIEQLSSASHPSLLLVEIGALDYHRPPHGVIERHSLLSDEAQRHLDWLRDWINSRRPDGGSQLDVVFYSRNPAHLSAFTDSGLPARPANSPDLNWKQFVYRGRNLPTVRFPGGPHPWGDVFSARDAQFDRIDGSPSDSPKEQQIYPGRTLRALLRGRSRSGQPVRLRFGAPPPVVPERSPDAPGIDAAFWSRIDVEAIEAALDRSYFGSRQTPAVADLMAELHWRRQVCLTAPGRLDSNEVRARWAQNSALVLWGEGGGGKSFLGLTIARLIFGSDAFLFSCQNAQSPVQFQAQFFGSAAGYVGSTQRPPVCEHLMQTRGYTVIILDEFNRIEPDNFAEGVKQIYGLVQDRVYKASNQEVHGGRPLPLWNTIFVATANLDAWPPAGVQNTDRGAIVRRFRAHEIRELSEEQVAEFVRWKLCRTIEDDLSGVAVCHCEPLPIFRAMGFNERTPDQLAKRMQANDGPIERVLGALVRSGVTVESAPAYFNITALAREALQ